MNKIQKKVKMKMKMNRKVSLLLVIVFLFTSINVLSNKEREISIFFLDGYKYVDLSEDEKSAYIIGVMDAIFSLVGNKTESNKENYRFFQIIIEKSKGMTGSQLSNILDNYLKNNLEDMYYSAVLSFIRALTEYFFGITVS